MKTKCLTKKRGVTLIELLVAIAIASTITGVIVMMLNNGLISWRFAHDRIRVQAISEELMVKVLEGDFVYDGLKDALEVFKAGEQSITIVPLYVDDTHVINSGKREFELKKKFLAGSPYPVVQVLKRGRDNYKTVSSEFIYGDDVVVLDELPDMGSKLRIIFYPDASGDPGVRLTIRYDKKAKTVYRIYKGREENLLKYYTDVQVEDFKFSYLDNLNNEVELEEDGSGISDARLKSIGGVNVYFKLKRKEDSKENVSFVSIRGRGKENQGAVLTEGAEIDIADSFNIGRLSLAHVDGVETGGLMVLEAIPKVGKVWRVELEFINVDNTVKIHRYTVEYPPGTIVASDTIDQRIGAGREFSFINFTENDMYDYDKDDNVDDMVRLGGDRVTLKVKQLDADGAYLLVWP